MKTPPVHNGYYFGSAAFRLFVSQAFSARALAASGLMELAAIEAMADRFALGSFARAFRAISVAATRSALVICDQRMRDASPINSDRRSLASRFPNFLAMIPAQ